MKGHTVKCPVCGTMNKSLFLEETEGTYECELCGYIGRIGGYRRIPEHSISIHRRIEDKNGHKKRRKLLLV